MAILRVEFECDRCGKPFFKKDKDFGDLQLNKYVYTPDGRKTEVHKFKEMCAPCTDILIKALFKVIEGKPKNGGSK